MTDRRPMLYLRRYEGEEILVFDARSETEIQVLEVDPELRIVRLRISGEDHDKVLAIGQVQTFLQGDGQMRVSAIQEFRNGKCYANIGIHAPQDMLIRRREMIAGTTREDRAAMVR